VYTCKKNYSINASPIWCVYFIGVKNLYRHGEVNVVYGCLEIDVYEASVPLNIWYEAIVQNYGVRKRTDIFFIHLERST